MTRSSLTEETPAVPGWVDRRIREIFGALGEAGNDAGTAYADCLAGVRGAVDVDTGHDRRRRSAVTDLEGKGVDVEALDRTLQALEAEISEAT